MTEPRELSTGTTRWQRRWIAVTDWLGARKPLDLILGAVVLIEGATVLAHLLG